MEFQYKSEERRIISRTMVSAYAFSSALTKKHSFFLILLWLHWTIHWFIHISNTTFPFTLSLSLSFHSTKKESLSFLAPIFVFIHSWLCWCWLCYCSITKYIYKKNSFEQIQQYAITLLYFHLLTSTTHHFHMIVTIINWIGFYRERERERDA